MNNNYTFFIQYPNKSLYVQEFDKPNTRKQAVKILVRNSLDYIKRHEGVIGLFCNGKKTRLTKDDFNNCSEWEQNRFKIYDSAIYAEWL